MWWHGCERDGACMCRSGFSRECRHLRRLGIRVVLASLSRLKPLLQVTGSEITHPHILRKLGLAGIIREVVKQSTCKAIAYRENKLRPYLLRLLRLEQISLAALAFEQSSLGDDNANLPLGKAVLTSEFQKI